MQSFLISSSLSNRPINENRVKLYTVIGREELTSILLYFSYFYYIKHNKLYLCS